MIKSLSEAKLIENKNRFIEILTSSGRFGSAELIKYLESTDFFTAPASYSHYGAFVGGLCDHSLKVYDIIEHLAEIFMSDTSEQIKSSLKIIALCHDLGKVNLFKQDYRNIKVFSDTGKQRDSIGRRFDWQSDACYIKNEEHLVFGSIEMLSEYITRSFIRLSIDESVSILHSTGGKGKDSAQDNIPEIYSNYKLAALLNSADMLATYTMNESDLI